MGQGEIYDYLKNKRDMGDYNFYSVDEVKRATNGNGKTWQQVNKLYCYGIIEVQYINFKRYVRIKI